MSQIRIERLTPERRRALNIPDAPSPGNGWRVWECPPSEFDWFYDRTEWAYLYEGRVKLKTSAGEYAVSAGDYVCFPAGLACIWKVEKKILKVYKFD